MVCRNELVCRLKWHDNNSLHQIGAFGIVNLVFWGMIAYSQNVIVMILYNQTEISFSLFLLKSKEGIRFFLTGMKIWDSQCVTSIAKY